MRDLVVERGRVSDFTTARPSGASRSTTAPMEIGATPSATFRCRQEYFSSDGNRSDAKGKEALGKVKLGRAEGEGMPPYSLTMMLRSHLQWQQLLL